MEQTGCVVVGGGPAGLVLGLLLARAGVTVTVLEKHGDFLRDFRGDTVHASTLTLLDELGLGERFAALPHQRVEHGEVHVGGAQLRVADFRRLPGAHQHIALVPQWDFLELLAAAAAEEPGFTLRQNAEVTGLRRDGGRVTGVVYRDRTTGTEHELRATLTVACDGRDSAVRAAAGLRPQTFEAAIDVEWFHLPREEGDPAGFAGWLGDRQLMIMLDRGDYWQCGYVIGKGQDAPLRAAGVEAFGARLAALVPWLGDRAAIADFDEVRLLNVRLERLRRWFADGLLVIGDAAHAMSPVGGVGVNLAVQDAVAAARVVGPFLATGSAVPASALKAVQRRRAWPTAVVHTVQRIAHAGLAGPRSAGVPLPLRLLDRLPAVQGITARGIAIGPRPERAPGWARRPH